jgi:chromosome segregation protein
VSQGRISAIIAAKPAERRALLEEAAGITGLHSRRHEAELKLKAAEANLARLDDVLTTLDTQFQGLKKQARQAARYRNMSDLIRRAEAVVLHLRWRAATAAREAAAQRLAEAERFVAEITGRAAHAATALADAQACLPDLRKTEAEAAARLARLGLAREQLEAEEARVNGALAEIAARLQQLAADQERERDHSADARTALARLAAEREGLAAVAAQATDEGYAVSQDLAACSAEVERLDGDVARLTAAVAAAEAERAALAREIADLAGRRDRLAARLADTVVEREKLEAAAANSGPQQAETQLRVIAAERSLVAARGGVDAAEAARRAAQEEEAGAREALRAAEADHARIEGEVAALTAVLAGGSAGEFPPVIDQITVQPGYEAALGAALGDDLAAPTATEASAHWRVMDGAGTAPELPAGAEALAGFVGAPPALARRLTQIGVVADEAEGERLAPHLAQGQRLVTLGGALWRWDGFTVKAGAPIAAATRLAQRRRLEDLRGPRAVAAESCAGARARFAAAQETSRAVEAKDSVAREAERHALAALQAAREERETLARAVAADAARRSGLAEQAERLAADLAEYDARHDTAQARLEALPDPIMQREELAADRAALGLRRARLIELQSAHDRLERETAARARRLVDISAEETAWTARAEGAERQLAVLGQRVAQTTADHERLALRPPEIAAERSALLDRLTEAEAARRAAADRLAEAESAVAAAGRDLKAIEAELGAARETRVRLEAENEQGERASDELVAHIRERLDCAPEETLAAGGLDPDDELPQMAQIEARLERLIKERDTMGPVNLRAEQEAAEVEQQMATLTTEKDDLVRAIARLRQGISNLNREGRERLVAAFDKVNKHFQELFVQLFGGGRAHLTLAPVDPADPADGAPKEVDPLEAGLEVMASPPGKKLQSLSLLSGGEQALTALALLFAVFLTNPAPVCVLDEVDAPLDDANVDRFCTLLDDIAASTGTRFVVVTHHRLTMARMDRLFGVTMSERGISQLVAVDLRSAERLRATA